MTQTWISETEASAALNIDVASAIPFLTICYIKALSGPDSQHWNLQLWEDVNTLEVHLALDVEPLASTLTYVICLFQGHIHVDLVTFPLPAGVIWSFRKYVLFYWVNSF